MPDRCFRRHPQGFLRLALAGIVVLLVTLPLGAQGSSRLQAQLTQAQELLDQERAEAAIVLLDEILSQQKNQAQALLLRSTARIMTGEVTAGIADLRRSLELDPSLRQGWLNLAGLEIAQQRFDEAYAALLEAEKLDPSAVDNALNLGAVQVLRGQVADGKTQFDRYLAQQPTAGDALGEALYLVAANYALAGVQHEAVAHLQRAIVRNERFRLQARRDERFVGLDATSYQELLTTDLYQPPSDSHRAATAFKVPYDPRDNKLLYAVLGALKKRKISYDPNVETNQQWALVWGETLRIKVTNQANGTGLVALSAPMENFSPEEWELTTQQLYRAIYDLLDIADVLGS